MLAVNDIVVAAPGWRAGAYVITAVHPERPKNCYTALSLVNQKKYRLSNESVRKVGVADPDLLTGPSEPQPTGMAYARGKLHATAMARLCGPNGDGPRWQILADATPGAKLRITMSGHRADSTGGWVTFHHVLERGQRFVFLATSSGGKTYKYPLNVLVVPALDKAIAN
jgi:hypothetical protein